MWSTFYFLSAEKNRWIFGLMCGLIFVTIFHFRFKNTNEAIQEFSFPKKEIIHNLDFFLKKCEIFSADKEECIICMENFEKEETVYKIKCPCNGKFYHKQCLSGWFEKSCSCPVCRKNLQEAFAK